MNTICPHCGSSHTQARDVVYKTGTSRSTSSGSFAGIGFGRRRGTSFWFGKSWRSGRHQTLLAQDAEPVSILAPFPLIIFSFLVGGEMFGFFVIAGWLLLAIMASWNYEDEWMCRKCGTKFIPSVPPHTSNILTIASSGRPVMKADLPASAPVKTHSAGQAAGDEKACSICGDRFPKTEFSYGNRHNRSYCRQCNKEAAKAYRQDRH